MGSVPLFKMPYNTNMDFKKVLTILIEEFDKHKIPYALIGAVAMGFNGIIRDTKDVDFAVARESASIACSIMEELGACRTFV